MKVNFDFYGALLTSCAGDGSCELSQPPPRAAIKPPLAVICWMRRVTAICWLDSNVVCAVITLR